MGTTQAEGCRLITAAYRLHEMEQVMDEVRSDCETLVRRYLPQVKSSARKLALLFQAIEGMELNEEGVVRAAARPLGVSGNARGAAGVGGEGVGGCEAV
jgi:hypothetical protein